jgi:hypothetical protein
MLMLWLMAAAAVGRIGAVRRAAHGLSAIVLEQRADHVADPARPGDRGQRQRQERARGAVMRVSLFVGVALYAWATVWALERWRRGGRLRATASMSLWRRDP